MPSHAQASGQSDEILILGRNQPMTPMIGFGPWVEERIKAFARMLS